MSGHVFGSNRVLHALEAFVEQGECRIVRCSRFQSQSGRPSSLVMQLAINIRFYMNTALSGARADGYAVLSTQTRMISSLQKTGRRIQKNPRLLYTPERTAITCQASKYRLHDSAEQQRCEFSQVASPYHPGVRARCLNLRHLHALGLQPSA